jgi:hypothetical protein
VLSVLSVVSGVSGVSVVAVVTVVVVHDTAQRRRGWRRLLQPVSL